MEILETKLYNFNSWKEDIITNISKIKSKHDFRQDEIIEQWKNFNFDEELISVKIKILVTSGFYIRQFVNDISEKINFPLLTFDINRTKIYY